jgi:predicted outer membrane protein
MKSTLLLFAAALALALALPASVHADKDPAKKEAKKATRAAMAPYDKNENGVIDADESEALKQAFEADKTGPLKQFDLNGDGKLDDSEIAAIRAGKRGEKKKKSV